MAVPPPGPAEKRTGKAGSLKALGWAVIVLLVLLVLLVTGQVVLLALALPPAARVTAAVADLAEKVANLLPPWKSPAARI